MSEPETPAPEARELLEVFPSLARLSDNELAVLFYTFGQLATEARKYALLNVIDFASRWLALLGGLLADAGYKDLNELKMALAAQHRRKAAGGIN